MPRVGFVTCARWPEVADSDALAARALRARGVEVVAVPWNARADACGTRLRSCAGTSPSAT